jgi:hypothetical protein
MKQQRARRNSRRSRCAVAAVFALSAMRASWGAAIPAEPEATLEFHGSPTADLFTRELEDSLHGVLDKDFVAVSANGVPAGFVNASPQGQPWYGTMWTRDAGTYLRELTMRGHFRQASLLAHCLMSLVETNSDGYFFYPRYFRGGKKGFGTELDGTSAIVIGLALLWERLPANDPTRDEIQAFLLGNASPIVYIRILLSRQPLLAGTGEFGCGMQVQGECDNVLR